MFHPLFRSVSAAVCFICCTSFPLVVAETPVTSFRDRLSTGGLTLLDRGEIIAPPATGRREGAATVPLDPRIGPNIRLGDDPAALPTYQRAQAEPHIMRSPTDLDFLVAAVQEGRFTDGGALDCGYATSHDGGLSWTRALIPSLTTTAGGPYYRATDPVVGVDLSNRVYIATDVATDPSFNSGRIVVSRSSDGGATFEQPVTVFSPASSTPFPDKEWLAVNTFPNTPAANRLVVTWTEFTNQTSSSTSPLMLSYSDDAGQTWSPAKFITPAGSYMQGSQPVFLANGKLAIVYWNFTSSNEPNGSERIEAIVSNDGGLTFSSPVGITHPIQYNEAQIRDGSFLPSAATDRTTGNIYVVWQAIYLGSPRIMFSKSTDSGATWTGPVSISDNPAGSGVFNAAINASADGQTLTAAFYDHRNNPGSATLIDLYLAQSFDGGATWQPNIRLTSTSSDASLAPNTGTTTQPAYMVGDYIGIADSRNNKVPAVPVWVDVRTGNPDPFVTRAGIAPQFTFDAWQAARLSYAQIEAPQGGVRPFNISTRLNVQTGDNVLIGGFVISGSDSARLLLRGIGPSLAAAGLSGVLQDPTLELHDSSGSVIALNDNWNDSQGSDIQNTGLAPRDNRESAILRTLSAGSYTVILRGQANSTGIGLVEAYDLTQTATAQLSNISTRGFVGNGDNVMIGGFILAGSSNANGTGSARILVRALGPSLARSGVTNPIADPLVELHDADGTRILADDNWKDTQQTEIAATGLQPDDDREAAVVGLVPPGSYTAILAGKNGTSGNALVEIYNLR